MTTTENLKPPHLPTPGPAGLVPADDEGPGSALTVIRPRPGWIAVNWSELVHSRELFATLVGRDIKIRYKQTVLGVAWAVIQPVLTMIVFTFVFGRQAGMTSGDVPYPLFVFAALVPWTFFANAVAGSALSLVSQQQLLTKVYFPRLYVPAATVGGFLVDLAIGLALFAPLMSWYGYRPGWGLLALPALVALTFAATLGVGLSLAAATLRFRDLRFVIPFALQIGMFVSPVIYDAWPSPPSVRLLASLNPMFGIINAYRSSILGTPWEPASLAIAVASTVALLAFGLFYFRKTERLIADIV